jgi:hypothetical protein
VPLPGPIPSGPAGGGFAAIGAIAGPAMMVLIALRKPGPVRTMLRAGAVSPETARKASTLGLTAPPLGPLIRAGVVIEEDDGRIWLDARRASRRQWRIGALIGACVALVGLVVAAALMLTGPGTVSSR